AHQEQREERREERVRTDAPALPELANAGEPESRERKQADEADVDAGLDPRVVEVGRLERHAAGDRSEPVAGVVAVPLERPVPPVVERALPEIAPAGQGRERR